MNIKELEKIIPDYPDIDLWVSKAIESLKYRANPYLENKILLYLSQKFRLKNDLPFVYPKQQIIGNLDLGIIIGTSYQYRIPSDRLNMHSLIVGMSGSGKTTFSLNIINQLLNNTNSLVHIIDPKADEYNVLSNKNQE